MLCISAVTTSCHTVRTCFVFQIHVYIVIEDSRYICTVNKSCLIVRESSQVNYFAMEKALAFNIENDHGQILYSLEKLHKSAVPSDTKRFEKVLRLWVSNKLVQYS